MPNSSRRPLCHDTICRTLADRLDDAVFARFFPGQDVQALRDALAPRVTPSEQEATAREKLPARLAAQMPAGWCSLCTDGASRGNPGHAGAGIVLYDSHGEEMGRRASYLGICTNNVAEYQALLLGLEEALRCGCRQLALFLDAELVVRQLQGRYKVRHEQLQPLYQKACRLLAGLSAWNAVHVPRADNALADSLANQGIDAALVRNTKDMENTDDAPPPAQPGALSAKLRGWAHDRSACGEESPNTTGRGGS